MKKALLFGAGGYGVTYYQNQTTYDILAFIDNDEAKENTIIEGKKVILPKDILIYDYDVIIIASTFTEAIYAQIIEMGINKESIIIPNKNELKQNQEPFQSVETREYAKKVLLEIVNFLKDEKIVHYVDYGTLLGIIRDNDLIYWDDDIDISMPITEYNKLLPIMDMVINKINKIDPLIQWRYFENRNSEGVLQNIVIEIYHNSSVEIMSFGCDIYIVKYIDDKVKTIFRDVPVKYLQDFIEYEYRGELINIPQHTTNYLAYIYGDTWNTPIKDTTFVVIGNKE